MIYPIIVIDELTRVSHRTPLPDMLPTWFGSRAIVWKKRPERLSHWYRPPAEEGRNWRRSLRRKVPRAVR